MNERFRLKFGRMVAGVRTWEADLDMPMLAEELQHEYIWSAQRKGYLRQDWSGVGNLSIRRRDNITLPYIVYLSEADMRRFQELGLWSADFKPITSYFDCYDSTYADKSTQGMNLSGTWTPTGVANSVFIGADEPFTDMDFLHDTFGVAVVRDINYYNGSAWVAVTSLVDNTSLFTADGNMSFTMPPDWEKTTRGGNLPHKYWIEIDFNGAGTKPVWTYTRPTVPIMVLLQRSVDNGTTWAWYHDEGYYPNLWMIEQVVLRFQVGGRHAIVDTKLMEGY